MVEDKRVKLHRLHTKIVLGEEFREGIILDATRVAILQRLFNTKLTYSQAAIIWLTIDSLIKKFTGDNK